MPEACVYLLRCLDGSLSTAWTVDFERRPARHHSGAAKLALLDSTQTPA